MALVNNGPDFPADPRRTTPLDAVARYSRWIRVVDAVGSWDGTDIDALCKICSDLLSDRGIGILIIGSGQTPLAWYTSGSPDPLERLQFTLGVGPGIEAFAQGQPIKEEDLLHRPPQRWVTFAQTAVDIGVLAVCSFPLTFEGKSLGSLTVYDTHADALDIDTFERALLVSNVVTQLLIARENGNQDLSESHMSSEEVNQAAGMVAGDLGVDVSEGLVRLRAWAFANNISVVEVADLIITRRLHIDT